MADMISDIAEAHRLLPPQHYWGRPGRTTEDALMILTENIHEQWRHNEIHSAVFMDVAGAFNNGDLLDIPGDHGLSLGFIDVRDAR
jgi:hypothetical protein